MKTIDRYVARTLAIHFLYGLLVLLAVFSIINLMQELEAIGTGGYKLRQALWYVFLTLPNEAYRLAPAAALLGSVTGLGSLASHHEIVAMGACGISTGRLTAAVLFAALWIVVAAVLVGEFVSAPLVKRAQAQRSAALSGGLAVGTDSGFWARDGSTFVHARHLLGHGVLGELYFFEFGEDKQLRTFTRAERAVYGEGSWTLQNLRESRFDGDTVATHRLAERVWKPPLDPRQLGLLFLRPEDLSTADLRRSIQSLHRRNESSDRQELALWRRIGFPFVAGVMVYIALPFVLASLPRTTFGARIVAAALLGLGFQMFNETFGSLALTYGLTPPLCALAPTLLALGAGQWAMRRVH